jgi:hypothetical protein
VTAQPGEKPARHAGNRPERDDEVALARGLGRR